MFSHLFGHPHRSPAEEAGDLTASLASLRSGPSGGPPRYGGGQDRHGYILNLINFFSLL